MFYAVNWKKTIKIVKISFQVKDLFGFPAKELPIAVPVNYINYTLKIPTHYHQNKIICRQHILWDKFRSPCKFREKLNLGKFNWIP